MSKRTYEQMAGLVEGTASLLESGKYSDLVIKLKDESIKVHRSVVCVQSNPFAAMADGPFLEASTGVIDLSDDDPIIMKLVLSFLYTGDYLINPSEPVSGPDPSYTDQDVIDYESPWTSESDNEQSGRSKQNITPAVANISAKDNATNEEALVVHTKVYTTAEKWDIQSLKHLAAQKYKDSLIPPPANRYLINSLDIMYNELPESDVTLKEIAIEYVKVHYVELAQKMDFLDLCYHHSALAVAVIKASAARMRAEYAVWTRKTPKMKPAIPRHRVIR